MSDLIPEGVLDRIQEQRYLFETFLGTVATFFRCHPRLNGSPPILHSIRSRLKDPEHLREKIKRKIGDGRTVSSENVFEQITDLAGVRVLHLYQDQFPEIHRCIEEHVAQGEWAYFESPRAYTWDPECRDFFERQGLEVHLKESFYTSIHYVVKPRQDSLTTCEIQVRTLFEEIWGEIDHTINYPVPTAVEQCREQILVLARLVGAGSRLADSIFRAHGSGQQSTDPAGARP